MTGARAAKKVKERRVAGKRFIMVKGAKMKVVKTIREHLARREEGGRRMRAEGRAWPI